MTPEKAVSLVEQLSAGSERKYGVRFQFTDSMEPAPGLPLTPDNLALWDESSKTVFVSKALANDPNRLLLEVQHEYGAVLLGDMYGGKYNIPRAGPMWMTHILDDVTKNGGSRF